MLTNLGFCCCWTCPWGQYESSVSACVLCSCASANDACFWLTDRRLITCGTRCTVGCNGSRDSETVEPRDHVALNALATLHKLYMATEITIHVRALVAPC